MSDPFERAVSRLCQLTTVHPPESVNAVHEPEMPGEDEHHLSIRDAGNPAQFEPSQGRPTASAAK
jgi:hypothetical protein